jgi:hypothetical protein
MVAVRVGTAGIDKVEGSSSWGVAVLLGIVILTVWQAAKGITTTTSATITTHHARFALNACPEIDDAGWRLSDGSMALHRQ